MSSLGLLSQETARPLPSTIRDLLKPNEKPAEWELVEWITCDTDSGYYHDDTIHLYRSYHYCFGSGCCQFVRWTLSPKYTFSLTSFLFCQEPPVSGITMENQDLKFDISGSENRTTIAIRRKKEVIDKFEVVDLRTVTLPDNMGTSQRLTLVRIRS